MTASPASNATPHSLRPGVPDTLHGRLHASQQARHFQPPACDGQILVMEDLLRLNPNPPNFVRAYASLVPALEAAVTSYSSYVRERRFPGPANVYAM